MRGFDSINLKKSISFADLRAVLAKMEDHYKRLRTEKADAESMFTSEDVTELAARFLELVGEGLQNCKEDVLNGNQRFS